MRIRFFENLLVVNNNFITLLSFSLSKIVLLLLKFDKRLQILMLLFRKCNLGLLCLTEL